MLRMGCFFAFQAVADEAVRDWRGLTTEEPSPSPLPPPPSSLPSPPSPLPPPLSSPPLSPLTPRSP